MTEAEFTNDWIMVDAVKHFDDDDDLLDALSNIRNVEEPNYFERESVNLSVDDREDISITLRGDENRYVYLHVGDEDGELHVHLVIDAEQIGPYIFMLEKILDKVGSLDVDELQSHYILDHKFSEASFSFSLPEEPNIVGIRVDLDVGNAIVQGHEDVTHVLYFKENGAALDGVMPGDYFDTELEEARDFIENHFTN